MLRSGRETKFGHMSFIMADIDFFTKVNDRFGHQAGGAVLRAVSKRMRSSLRSYDVHGRYGGGEFLVMLPNTDLYEALAVAHRVRHAVCREPIMCNGIPLTVSVGVADMLSPDDNIDQAINRAEEPLYAAKKSGRNCVCSAPQSGAAMELVDRDISAKMVA